MTTGSMIPDYLRRMAQEGEGDPQAVGNELRLCQIDATEAQTAVQERIAAALEGKGEAAPVSMRTALMCCQDGDPIAAAHVLHSALAETEARRS